MQTFGEEVGYFQMDLKLSWRFLFFVFIHQDFKFERINVHLQTFYIVSM